MKNKRLPWLLGLITMGLLLGACQSSSGTSQTTYPDDIVNGGFENGNLNGWIAKGLGAFLEENITNAATVNEISVGKEGNYFFSGIEASLPSYEGSLESDYFTLKGIGHISFRLGAGQDATKTHIQFFRLNDVEPLSFTVNGGSQRVTSVGNMDFNGTTITDQMIVKYVDLSYYLDEVIKIVVTDRDTKSEISDYSYVNIDDFNVIANASEKNAIIDERANQLALYAETPFDEDPTATTLRNGGFELNDMTGWNVLSGNAFGADNIVPSSTTFWETRQYHASGAYFFDGFATTETATGRMRSEKFTLEDKANGGYASFKLGGAKYATTYVAVMDGETNAEIVRVTNKAFKDPTIALNMATYYLDLTEHKGKVLYFLVVDERNESDFGAIVLDDFRINLTNTQVIDEISALRSWSQTVDDSVAQAAYEALYQGGLSFPIAGDAPIIEEAGGYALEASLKPRTNYNLYDLFPLGVSYRDDYTATSDLVKTITSVTKGSIPVASPNLVSFDLSEENIYEIAFNVKDEFQQQTASVIKLTISNATVYPTEIPNGGFETGDLTGWQTIQGTVDPAAVYGGTHFWVENIPYNQSGAFHFDGWLANSVESASYALRSDIFLLSGSGHISFKMGGNSSAVKVFKSDGTPIAAYRNSEFADINFPDVSQGCRLATMVTYVADLSSFIGEDLYIEIWDLEITGGWAVAFFDEIVTYYEAVPNVSELYDTVTQNETPINIDWEWASNTI